MELAIFGFADGFSCEERIRLPDGSATCLSPRHGSSKGRAVDGRVLRESGAWRKRNEHRESLEIQREPGTTFSPRLSLSKI